MSLFALQVLLVGGAVQGLCLAWLLAARRVNPLANRLANRLLAGLILLVSAQSVLVAFDNREFFLAFPHLSRVGWLLPALFGPLIYLFTRKLTSETPRLRGRDALHLLPFAAVLMVLLPYYLQPAAVKIAYLSDFKRASQDDFGWLNQLLNVQHISYLLWSLHALRQHERRILNEFSDLTHVRLRWLRQFLLLTLGVVITGIAAFYGRKWEVAWLTQVYHFHYLGVIGLIYWTGYKALAQPMLFGHVEPTPPATSRPGASPAPVLPLPADTPAPGPATELTATGGGSVEVRSTAGPAQELAPKYLKSAMSEEQAQLLLERLLAFMEEARPYQQNDLTIQALAQAVDVPKHQLSQLINEKLGKNFYDFVNEYRVAEVKRLLRHPRYAHYTTLAVAEEAGFNSKATFNAVFKKLTGMTPSEFAKKPEMALN